MFESWICKTTKDLVPCDAVRVHWANERGCLPDLNNILTQTIISPTVRTKSHRMLGSTLFSLTVVLIQL